MGIKHNYTTEGLPPFSKLDTWRDYMSTVYYSLDVVPLHLDKVRGSLTEAHFGSIGVSHFSADAQRVVRHKAAAQRDGSENYVFLFPTQGSMGYEQLGRTGIAEPGGLILLNSSEGYAVTVPDGSENITIKIPCDHLRARLPQIDQRCGRAGIANRHLIPVVSQFGRQLLELDRAPDRTALLDTMSDLVGLMMDTASHTSLPESIRQPLLQVTFDRLQSYIGRHFRDPGLSPATAAQANRISVRYLHKVFQGRGTTFGHMLIETRLDEAHRLLMSSERRLSIGEIAYRCGFINQAHFSSRYRDRFQQTPRQTRSWLVCTEAKSLPTQSYKNARPCG